MLDNLNRQMFDEHLGEPFFVELLDQTLELQLVEVTTLDSLDSNESQRKLELGLRAEGFSILFRGPLDVTLNQGMVMMSNEKIGSFDPFFLVPVGADEQGRYYEAVFN